MQRITSLAGLLEVQRECRARREKQEREIIIINLSLATCGIASGGNAVLEAMKDEVARQGLQNVVFMQSGCMTYCHSEPTVEIRLPGKEPVVFGKLDPQGARQLVEEYVKQGEPGGVVIPVNYTRVVL